MSEITALGAKLIEVLREFGDWMNRRQIANALGRPRSILSPHDINILGQLQQRGLIEIEKLSLGTVKFEWRYRIKK